MSINVRELTDDEWTISIPERLVMLLKIHTGYVNQTLEDHSDEKVFVSEFLKRGLITKEAQDLCLSERGTKLVEMILATPLPLHEWADPRKGKVRDLG